LLRLSRRLMALAQMVPRGAKIADIGTDHAFLPCYLLKEHITPAAIGVEVNKGPYQKACATIEEYGLQEKIEIRLGNGLTVIKPGEIDVVIIAGMGGAVIRDILERSPQLVVSLDKLIIQPMKGAELVRYWLIDHGWLINEEELIYEDKQYYQIIGAKQKKQGEHRKNDFTLTEIEAIYGPLLLKKRHPLLVDLVEKDIKGWQEILNELAKSDKEGAKLRFLEYRQKLQELKELRKWLLVAKP
jgi:tRNA (adenine22-N1)-methyltransferase